MDDISLKIESGKISTLLGRNGAGKTTFVRICSTQLLPTSGKVLIFGDDVVSSPEKIRKIVSIVTARRETFTCIDTLGLYL